MKAIRWVGFQSNSFIKELPNDLKLGFMGSISAHDALKWELNPNREICVEIMYEDNGSFCRMQDGIGLILDMEESVLHRVYAEDGWTAMTDGHIRSTCVDESTGKGENWSDTWKDIESVYHSIPVDERETWCEGIVSSPQYVGYVLCEDADSEELEPLIQQIFGDLPQIEIMFA